MSADLIALLDSDPAAGILAVADLRERWAAAAQISYAIIHVRPGPGVDAWPVVERVPGGWQSGEHHYPAATVIDVQPLEYIAAEANPAHALAAVRRWRGVVERHTRDTSETEVSVCVRCVLGGPDGFVSGIESWPCPDLTETADEARAYLGGAA